MSKRLLLWSVVTLALVGFIVGLVYLAKQDAKKSPEDRAPRLSADITAADWVKGPVTSSVALVEYSDLQCPACAYFHPIMKQLMAEYGDRVRFVYRHFPLRQIHTNAELAARAAEAAGKQGKFWEMLDILFENQTAWASEGDPTIIFRGYAESLGVNGEQFMRDLSSPDVAAKLSNDVRGGDASKVEGTPTFFLKGVRIENPRSYDEFKSVIERAIEGDA